MNQVHVPFDDGKEQENEYDVAAASVAHTQMTKTAKWNQPWDTSYVQRLMNLMAAYLKRQEANWPKSVSPIKHWTEELKEFYEECNG